MKVKSSGFWVVFGYIVGFVLTVGTILFGVIIGISWAVPDPILPDYVALLSTLLPIGLVLGIALMYLSLKSDSLEYNFYRGMAVVGDILERDPEMLKRFIHRPEVSLICWDRKDDGKVRLKLLIPDGCESNELWFTVSQEVADQLGLPPELKKE